MNVKTTLGLTVALVILVIAFVIIPDRSTSQTSSAGSDSASVEAPLIDPDFGDATDLRFERRGQPAMHLTLIKGETVGDDRWQITEPFDATATKWMVEGVLRRLKGSKIQLTYSSGAAGAVTASQADIEQPRQTVTMTNADGKTIKVAVGKPASDRTTYARLDDTADVHVVTPALKDLLKEQLTEFRDLSLFKFEKSDVTQIEIVESSAGNESRYLLTRTDDDWVFAEPFKARAIQKKVTDLINAMSRLRVAKWIDDGSTARGVFGLEHPAWTVSLTVEHRLEPETEQSDPADSDGEIDQEDDLIADAEQEAGEEPESDPAVTITTVFTLHISDRGPVSDTNKVYIRRADQAAIATLADRTAEKFAVAISDWRDMTLITAPVATADKITLTNASGTATFERSGSSWHFTDREDQANSVKVRALLQKLRTLEARAFAEDSESPEAAFGLDEPQATVEISMPGQTDIERLDVGAYTDLQTKRMVYVRRQGSTSVAKVRLDDVADLFEPPFAFLDRQIFDMSVESMDRITLLGIEPSTRRPFGLALSRINDQYTITSPAELPTNTDKSRDLAEALSNLTAAEIVAEAGSDSDYGLNTPSVTAVIRLMAPVAEVEDEASESADEEEDADDEAEVDDEGEPPAPEPRQVESRKLLVADHDGMVYAKRADRETIYRIDRSLYEMLVAEYHTPELLDFQESQATGITVTTSSGAMRFEKRGDQWVFSAEPDLPIDRKKVESLIAQVKNITTQRYLVYQTGLAEFGLDEASRAMTIEVEDEEGSAGAIWVSSRGSQQDPENRLYAALAGTEDVFLLPADTLERFQIAIEDYEAP